MHRTLKQLDEEYVMVIPSNVLWEGGYFQGLHFDTEKYLSLIEDRNKTIFKKRKDAESDPSYKQIIPYVILSYKNTLFSYRRGKLLSEKRLVGNYSIGIGGHISVNDVNLFDVPYKDAMRRELYEEVEITASYSQWIVGLINDDSNDVGKVHFGIVYIFDLESPDVKSREKSINEGKFVAISSLQKDIKKYENWSQICISDIDTLVKQR